MLQKSAPACSILFLHSYNNGRRPLHTVSVCSASLSWLYNVNGSHFDVQLPYFGHQVAKLTYITCKRSIASLLLGNLPTANRYRAEKTSLPIVSYKIILWLLRPQVMFLAQKTTVLVYRSHMCGIESIAFSQFKLVADFVMLSMFSLSALSPRSLDHGGGHDAPSDPRHPHSLLLYGRHVLGLLQLFGKGELFPASWSGGEC